MPSLKDFRGRIKSVKNTQQITKTMKMVSAAKVIKAREACEQARPYAEKLAEVLNGLAQNLAGSAAAPLLLRGREDVKIVRLVVFGSQRGLCGGFNANLVKAASQTIRALKAEGKTVQIVTVGRKVRDGLRMEFAAELYDSQNDLLGKMASYSDAQAYGTQLVHDFEEGKCDRVVVMFNTFVSMMTQKPTLLQLAPFKAEETAETATQTGIRPVVEYEPSEDVIMERLLPRNVSMQVFRAMIETQASEHAARMTAMDSATRNAGDMIKRMNLIYNRTRQAIITKEMIEIVSGAEAVK